MQAKVQELLEYDQVLAPNISFLNQITKQIFRNLIVTMMMMVTHPPPLRQLLVVDAHLAP